MKKRLISMFLVAVTTMSLMACGVDVDISFNGGESKETVQESTTSTVESTVESSEAIVESTAQSSEVVAESAETVVESTEASVEESSAEVVSGDWVDLDNLKFYINGKEYVVGETTLQELIDDGVPFDADDIANAGNNLNKNSESSGFKIILDEYWSAQVSVGNYTDSNATMKDLPITEVYLPNHPDEAQNIISFTFPLDMTEDELKAQAGEPTEFKNYTGDNNYVSNTYEYTRESTMYYGDWGYKFEFINGELKYMYITYMP